jgi:hypothetical protein
MKVKAMQFPSSPGTRKEVLARAGKLVEVACIGENHIKNEGYNDGGGGFLQTPEFQPQR